MTYPLAAFDLGKRYGKSWALQHCTVTIPQGSVSALIGPNGAGKSTFLRLAVGLATPSTGLVSVFGRDPEIDAAKVLPRIGFVAQDRPLCSRLSVKEMCDVGAKLNKNWDRKFATSRLHDLGIDLKQGAGKLSGGQQAQLALVLALAKHPDLILLDEPTSSLDPLARREFLQVLMEAVVSDGATVVLSSHHVADLERVCDHLVIVAQGKVRAYGELEGFRDAHKLVVGQRAAPDELLKLGEVVHASNTDRQTTALVRPNGHLFDARWRVQPVGFEEIILGYLAESGTVESEELERMVS
jgi:ABC-2 type transport system ATP-binding protein